MAGAGFKTFATGDVLTASDVNTYLMQQTVMVFASAAARTTALGANVAQGMLSYLKDSNTTAYYDGSAWQTLSTGGDITSVTTAANSGLAGGATSGDVALKLNTAAKGDLMVGTGSGTASALTAGSDGSILVANSVASTGLSYQSIGTNGQVLTVDTTQATKMKWATPASGGGMTLLSTTTLSGATTSISYGGGYNSLIAYVYNVTNATADGLMRCTPNTNQYFASWGAFKTNGTKIGRAHV